MTDNRWDVLMPFIANEEEVCYIEDGEVEGWPVRWFSGREFTIDGIVSERCSASHIVRTMFDLYPAEQGRCTAYRWRPGVKVDEDRWLRTGQIRYIELADRG